MIRSKRSRQIKFVTDINITPFTDVCLVLLIIFMVTAPAMIQEAQFHLNLPKVATAETPMPATVTVVVTAQNEVFVNNKPSNFTTLAADIQQVHQDSGARVLVLKADKSIPYGTAMQIIDIANQVGVDRLGLAAKKIETTPIQE